MSRKLAMAIGVSGLALTMLSGMGGGGDSSSDRPLFPPTVSNERTKPSAEVRGPTPAALAAAKACADGTAKPKDCRQFKR